jgi:hypothetical protein
VTPNVTPSDSVAKRSRRAAKAVDVVAPAGDLVPAHDSRDASKEPNRGAVRSSST